MIKPNRIGEPDTHRSLSSQDKEQLPDIDASALSVIHRLREAYDTAFACGKDAWEFSVKLPQMQKLGVETHILRMLICKDWIVHQRETTLANQSKRTFEPVNGLVLSDQSCFVISKQGYELAKLTKKPGAKQPEENKRSPMSSHHSGPLGPSENPQPSQVNQLGSSSRPHLPVKPVWDRERRVLRLGDIVVKRFKWPAENQELVLNAFEDLGWPARIDDPLVAHPTICPKRRLHDTLKCLNRKQVNELVKFRGDGTGLGVLLEIRLAD